jgi:hypothetical protein
MTIIHDRTGDGMSTAIMDMVLSLKQVERYERQDGWPALVFDDGSVLKFVSNEIEGIAIYRHAGEDGNGGRSH